MRRLPWPWEGQPDPLASAGRVDLSRIVALPDPSRPGPGGGPITRGETPGARDTIDRLTGDLVQAGHTVESAARRARTAAIRWDRRHR